MDSDERLIGTGRVRWSVSADHADLAPPTPAGRRISFAAEPKTVTVDLARTAMMVIDMQNDFCAAGGWLDHLGVDVAVERAPIAPLQALLPALREAGLPVIWLNWGNRPDRLNLPPGTVHIYDRDGQSLGLGAVLPKTGARVLEKDSRSAAVVDELAPEPHDIRVDKYRISGFWDTPLDSILRNLGCTTVLFAGVNVDQCVLHTLADASFLGYGCILVQDCCATNSPAACVEATLYNVRQVFGFVARSSALLDGLR